ncbi:MAG: polysaccharide biosynthesis/export family protein, partial [Myxococcota bacterium]
MTKSSPVRLTALLWLMAAAGSCAHAANEIPRDEAALAPPTALGPGDVFEVRVFGEQDLTGVHRVGSDGTINFPLVGRVEVAGHTASEVSAILSQRLGDFVRQPHVSLFVKEFNSQKVYVLGQVNRPGTFPYEDGMNIIQAVTLAGGF